MKKIVLTSDIDWAHEEVIQDFLDLLEEYQAKCTLFCTHDSKAIKGSDTVLFEKAIHPNFNPSLINGAPIDADQTLNDILEIYPEAMGIRSHGMTSSTPLQNLFYKKGLKYDSNLFLPYHWNLKPFKSWTGLTTIPYHWEDDIHFTYQNSFRENPIEQLQNFELLVFDFHPIHIFLNTDCEQTYLDAKKDYHNINSLKKYINTTQIGVRDFLVQLFESCKTREDISFAHMKDLIIE